MSINLGELLIGLGLEELTESFTIFSPSTVIVESFLNSPLINTETVIIALPLPLQETVLPLSLDNCPLSVFHL